MENRFQEIKSDLFSGIAVFLSLSTSPRLFLALALMGPTSRDRFQIMPRGTFYKYRIEGSRA